MFHLGVQEFFKIECRTRVFRSIFKLNVVHCGPRKLEQEGRGDEGAERAEGD